jgi:hypothetical protein
VTKVIWVADTTVKPETLTPPIVSLVAPVKPVPVTVTVVPPALGPEVGLIEVIVGPATVRRH